METQNAATHTELENRAIISPNEITGNNLITYADSFFQEYDLEYVILRLNKAFATILEVSKDPDSDETHKYTMDELADLYFSIDAASKLLFSTHSAITRHEDLKMIFPAKH